MPGIFDDEGGKSGEIRSNPVGQPRNRIQGHALKPETARRGIGEPFLGEREEQDVPTPPI